MNDLDEKKVDNTDKTKKKKSSSLLKKIIIVIGIIVIGLVAAYLFLSKNNNSEIKEEAQSEETEVATSYHSEDLSYDIEFMSKDKVTADYISINVDSNTDLISEKELKLAVEASKLIDGLNLEYTNTDGGLKINAYIEREKINDKLIDLVLKLGVIGEDQKDLLTTVANGNIESIKDALSSAGYELSAQ